MAGEINWGLLQVPDIGQSFKAGYDGQRQKNALMAYAQDPSNDQALNSLAEFQPAFVIQQKQLQAKTALDQAEEKRKAAHEQMPVISRLLGHAQDEASYQQALAAARQFGIDVTGAPANYNPQWVGQMKMIADAYNKDGGQSLSTFGKIAQDEGYQPGTPQYAARVTQLVQADAIKTISYTQGGGVAGYNAITGQTSSIVQPNTGGVPAGTPVNRPTPKQAAAPIPPKPVGLTDEQIFQQAHEAVRNGANADDVFRRLQAWGMNP